ncbi:ferredoxin--NADP reductase [Echinimonas agarilytica]|uniref:ferredoxin--NADP(+) reductase n=1 Tax=Echinimonas agarilytica TaxID=1215918 RepID=A0AA42B962_9GAMM|nr:ferredoxin--NADP reductase [Echinimonas agarilytica]MCM2681233.1 ferredoxin--NADP reductase [Echinimonas agarilytica]
MVEIPNGLIEGRVLQREIWTEQLFTLTIEAAVEPYQAGQFTKLGLVKSNGEWVRRAYSFVNSPEHAQGFQCMEFLIIKDDQGELTPLLHALTPGDSLYVARKASGFMTLNEIPEQSKDLWLMATGTAIGPHLAILDTQEAKTRFENIVLVHGVRTTEDLVYQERITQLGRHWGQKFRYVPVVSRENNLKALRGRIPALIGNGELERGAALSLDVDRSFVYLCGNPAMVKDTSEALKALGLTKHLRRKDGQFNSENYW